MNISASVSNGNLMAGAGAGAAPARLDQKR